MKKFAKFISVTILALAVFMSSSVVANAAGSPYAIYVNTALNCVTVMSVDAYGNETPYKAMVCSAGREGHLTPLGTFSTYGYYDWCYMVDGTYGRYSVRFNGGILFHSVPYLTKSVDSLEWDQYNLLGQNASLGCIRLSVADCKWIYDNCPYGTKVVVYYDATNPGPLGKPEAIKIDPNSPNRGWDPTDPSPSNPWNSNGIVAGVVAAPVNTSGAGNTTLTYDNFNYIAYADSYGDLKAAFGYDKSLLWYHYNHFGKREGRVATAL